MVRGEGAHVEGGSGNAVIDHNGIAYTEHPDDAAGVSYGAFFSHQAGAYDEVASNEGKSASFMLQQADLWSAVASGSL